MHNIDESQINAPDVKAIFNIAADMRSKPTGLGKMFKHFRKDKIEVADLQQAWQQAGYPDDIRDIEHILKEFGFGKKEINKVFTSAFGEDNDGNYAEPVASPAILKIAEYAKSHGIEKELIAFMQKEYGFQESRKFNGKAVIEDVRYIFDAIVHEERSALPNMIKDVEQAQLGRNRK